MFEVTAVTNPAGAEKQWLAKERKWFHKLRRLIIPPEMQQ